MSLSFSPFYYLQNHLRLFKEKTDPDFLSCKTITTTHSFKLECCGLILIKQNNTGCLQLIHYYDTSNIDT